jgi:hypothetical protein
MTPDFSMMALPFVESRSKPVCELLLEIRSLYLPLRNSSCVGSLWKKGKVSQKHLIEENTFLLFLLDLSLENDLYETNYGERTSICPHQYPDISCGDNSLLV